MSGPTRWPSARLAPLAATATLLALCGPARAADVEPAVRSGLQYLAQAGPGQPPGYAALAALAMVKADVPPTEPGLAACLSKTLGLFGSGGGFTPRESGGHDIYEAAVALLALANLDPVAYRPQIQAAAQYLISRQKANGSWDYPQREAGDTSISQYAVLGLWEAENVGVDVPPRVWDDAASWYLSVQSQQGSWNYHRDEASAQPETLSMTAAGVGSLLICQRQLANTRRAGEGLNPLMTPIGGAQRAKYEAKTSNARINQGVQQGLAWIGRNFNLASGGVIGQSAYYGLYGIERIGALSDRVNLGGVNWFDQGTRFILSTQRPGGSWTANYGDVANTAWAILFMVKSTKRSIDKVQVRRLGAGTLLGGRGLPKDLSSLTVAGGKVVVRPMSGAIDGMLDVLADPRNDEADSALAGLVEKYNAGGPKVLKPHRDRFIALLGEKDPGSRRVAVWALAHLGDLDAAPRLIATLRDPDETVVAEAVLGLQLLSRKIDGYGPGPGATPDEREAAAKRWQEWYDSTRPLASDAAGAATTAARGANPGRPRP